MKLELKHLAPYLPYSLKIKVGDGIDTMQSLEECIINLGFESYYGYGDCEPEFTPILRPLSDLTREIDGIVHLVELAKIANPDWDEYIDPKIDYEHESYYVEFKKWHGEYEGCTDFLFTPSTMYFSQYVDGDGWSGICNILGLIEYLLQHHLTSSD